MSPTFPAALLSIPALVTLLPVVPRTDATTFLSRRLDLTPAQEESVRAILAAHHDALLAKADSFHDARRRMVDACLDASVPPARLEALQIEASSAGAAVLAEVHQTVQDLDTVLTPAQKLRARSFLNEAQARFDGLRSYVLGR